MYNDSVNNKAQNLCIHFVCHVLFLHTDRLIGKNLYVCPPVHMSVCICQKIPVTSDIYEIQCSCLYAYSEVQGFSEMIYTM